MVSILESLGTHTSEVWRHSPGVGHLRAVGCRSLGFCVLLPTAELPAILSPLPTWGLDIPCSYLDLRHPWISSRPRPYSRTHRRAYNLGVTRPFTEVWKLGEGPHPLLLPGCFPALQEGASLINRFRVFNDTCSGAWPRRPWPPRRWLVNQCSHRRSYRCFVSTRWWLMSTGKTPRAVTHHRSGNWSG